MGFFKDIVGGITDTLGLTTYAADEAAAAGRQAAGVQADYQREALDYLKEREELPQQFREGALMQLAGLYGLEGGEGDQEAFIERAMASPIYSTLLEQGEEAALRTRAATGGLRSGGAISDIQDVQNQALLTSYNQQLQGLQGLASLPSSAAQIAQMTGDIGQTLAQGITGSAQAQAAGRQQQQAGLGNLAQIGLAAFGFSDLRLKENVKHVGYVGEHKWYEWTWNAEAKALGLSGNGQGVMAHEVYETNPDLIGECEGYITVNYGAVYG